MSEDDPAGGPVLAVRIGPGNYLVAAGRMQLGQRFAVDGRTFEVVAEPVPVAALTALATVREVDGPDQDREFPTPAARRRTPGLSNQLRVAGGAAREVRVLSYSGRQCAPKCNPSEDIAGVFSSGPHCRKKAIVSLSRR
jgi:hypothetical protein